MKGKISLVKKQLALTAALCTCITNTAFAGSMPVSITEITKNSTGNALNGMKIEIGESIPDTAKAIAAVYDEYDNFIGMSFANIPSNSSGTTEITFDNPIEFTSAQHVKAFVWDMQNDGTSVKPLSGSFPMMTSSPDVSPTVKPTAVPTVTPSANPSINPTVTPTIAPTAVPDTANDGIIHLNGTYISALNADGEPLENIIIDGTTVTITAAGDYEITGSLSDGQIIVDPARLLDAENTNEEYAKDKVNITLNNVSVTSLSSSPLYAPSGKLNITLAEGTSNTFTDSSAYTNLGYNDEIKGCIHSRRDINIESSGSGDTLGRLTVNANYKNGISTKADLKIKSGIVDVKAVNHGLSGNNSVTVQGNSVVSIDAGNDGIQSDNEKYETGIEDLGTVTVKSSKKGTPSVTIKSVGDGIQAFGFVDISDGIVNITSGEDSIKTNGTLEEITLDDDAVDADGNALTELPDGLVFSTITISGGEITINSSQDGIQADTAITISNGVINIESCLEDAINCSGSIEFAEGTLTIVSTQDAVQADTQLTILGGTINITTDGGYTSFQNTARDGNTDSIDYSCKGLKSDNAVVISGGNITVNSRDDSIHSDGSVLINGGTLTLASGDDGVHAETTLTVEDGETASPDITVTTSYEGFEGYKIYINGGYSRIKASDDSVNAAGEETGDTQSVSARFGGGPGGGNNNRPGNMGGGMDENSGYGYLYINGGTLVVNSGGDGIDSNGIFNITGGTVLINGPTSGGNGILDSGDNDGVTVTGGLLIGVGTKDMPVYPKGNQVSGYYTFSNTQSAGTLLNLQDANGNSIFTFAPEKNYQMIIFSSPDLQLGSTYSLYSGGTCSSAPADGLYTDGTYSGGTKIASFTPSNSGSSQLK